MAVRFIAESVSPVGKVAELVDLLDLSLEREVDQTPGPKRVLRHLPDGVEVCEEVPLPLRFDWFPIHFESSPVAKILSYRADRLDCHHRDMVSAIIER